MPALLDQSHPFPGDVDADIRLRWVSFYEGAKSLNVDTVGSGVKGMYMHTYIHILYIYIYSTSNININIRQICIQYMLVSWVRKWCLVEEMPEKLVAQAIKLENLYLEQLA